MKKLMYVISVFCLFVFMSDIAVASGDGKPLILKGDIGGYKVEMEILSSVLDSATFEGRYKYMSQENYLSIKGNNYGNCIYIEEYYDGKTTGSFYLERAGDTLTGHWLNEAKVFTVLLVISSGNRELLTYKTLEDYNAEVTDKITGTYQISYNYINDYFVSEESPFAYEIGFNGGFIIFEEVGADSLKFELEFICGPTYHFALAEGIAVKQGDVYVYSEDPYDMGENCKIVFKFGYKTVSAEAENSQSCGFGARAYVDHELIKVAD